MTSVTYSQIYGALIDWAQDDDDDFTANIPLIVSLGLARVVRDLDLELFKSNLTGTFSTGIGSLARNAAEVEIEEIWFTDPDDGKEKPIIKRSYPFCKMYWPVITSTGKPKYWAEDNEGNIIVVPTPATTYPWRRRSLVRPTDLTDQNPTNFIAERFGDLLHYACLIESGQFLMEPDAQVMAGWGTRYIEILPQARDEVRSMRRDTYDHLQPTPQAEKGQ